MHLVVEPTLGPVEALCAPWRQNSVWNANRAVESTLQAEGTMAVKEEVKKRKRSHIARERVQAAWVSVIVLCSMLILGAVLLAFTDNYDWLLK